LALSLSRESFVPLADIYRTIASRLAVHVEELGPLDIYSAQTLMRQASSEIREKVFISYENTWKKQGSIFATLLNQIYGYRVEIMRQRGVKDPLHESLYSQRVSRTSIDMMWRVVNDRKASLIVFLNKKALFFKNKRASWTDIWASLVQENKTPLRFYEATQWVHAALSRLGPEIAEFARNLSSNHSISNRGMKQMGINSFTLPLPLKRQVRVFLGYNDDIEQLVDYGRQLANAWRYHVLFDYPELLQHCPMIVSEAFQVFTERFVLEVVKERGFSRQQQFDALFAHVQKAAVNILDMQVRYLFESRLFTERSNGSLSEDRLCEMMREAQKIAYAGQIGSYFPYYWASKDHFYNTTAPAFQNYPQTMGYLIGLALYKLYKERPQGFCEKIKKWLQESTVQSSIEMGLLQHFNIKLDSEVIWNEAITLLESDVRSLADLMEIKDKTFALEMKGY
jgi:oligoendopeptidase F